jgi:hypothetical protein
MGEPHVHVFIRRSAEYGGRLGPIALVAGVGGFVVWLATLDSAPAVGAVGWLVGFGGMTLGLCAALASAVGLLSPERRRYALRGLLTASLGILIPAGLALLVISLAWN